MVNRSLHTSHRVLAAGGAALLVLAVASWAATPGASAASPSPTPCHLLGGLLPPPSGSTPCPLVSLGPGPTATPTPPGSAGATAGGFGRSAPGAPLTPSPPATASNSDGTVSGGFLDILGVLAPPANVGVEQPALEHFSLTTSSGPAPAHAAVPAPPSAPAAPGPAAWPALLALAGVAVAGAAALRPPRWLRRRRRTAPGALLAVVALALTVAMTAPPAQAPTGNVAPATLRSAAPVPKQLPTRAELLFSRLTVIEANVAERRAQAAALTLLAEQTRDDDAVLGPPRAARSVAASPESSSRQAADAYQAALQAEYQFFVGTLQDTAARSALVAAAGAAPASARDAITYDVDAIQAVLAQEAAISAAQQGDTVAGAPTAAAPATLTAPLSGTITQSFGPTALIFEPPISFQGVTYAHFHTGVDIAAPLDTPVAAAGAGVVVLAGASTDALGRLVGYGNYIVISHGGGLVTLYAHLDTIGVHAGQVVHAGEVIGREGSTGYSTGPHLHFEVRVHDALTDPLRYLGGQLAG